MALLRIIRKPMSTKVTAPVGYKPIEGTCALPEKIVNKKKNEIWLIRAPVDVYYYYVDNNCLVP